ncbi:hypothetical protein LCGC14_1524590 [marine sediment metagenome]|uniref:Purple acid phosphatase N-terminal domain-containing protein n=1 Tax=marine sediment metagenome TaxID=412755 RepID=A0A0F9IXK3_9ZZZZ
MTKNQIRNKSAKKNLKIFTPMLLITVFALLITVGFGVKNCQDSIQLRDTVLTSHNLEDISDLPDSHYPLYVSFQYSMTSGIYTHETPPKIMGEQGKFSFDLQGLSPETTYYYRSKAITSHNLVILSNNERSFTTLSKSKKENESD